MPPTSTRSLDTEALLEHAGWMRKLALSLVGDAQRADDLAQDTWVRALEKTPRTDLPLRGWLATVMRNVLRQNRRGELRREQHEASVAREDETKADDSGLAALARVTMQRELVEAVLTLEEPYRTAILLRYSEELSPRRIAQKQGIPVSTVKTRLARGLDRLRQRLDVSHGRDGKAWVMALCPLVQKPSGLGPALPSLPLSLGALAVNSKALLTAAALTVIGAGFFWSRRDSPERPGEQVIAAATTTPERRLESTNNAPSLAEVSKTPRPTTRQARAPSREAQPEASTPGGGLVAKGRVVDVQGLPVPGLEIVPLHTMKAETASISATTQTRGISTADGTFSMHLQMPSGLVVDDPRYVTVMSAAAVDEAMGKEPILVVAPKIRVAGTVIDEFGAPISGARISLSPPPSFRGDLGWVLDYSAELPFATRSGEDGGFDLIEAPRFQEGRIQAKAQGYLEANDPAPRVTRHDLVIVLPRPNLEGDRLTGIVLDPRGLPVPGASVSMGVDTTATDSNGEFSFDLADPESFNSLVAAFVVVEANELLALKEGHMPGRFKARGADENGRPIWPDHVVLQLGGDPLSIEGRVLDERGKPLANMRVWLEDPTFFGGRPEEGRGFPSLTHIETELSGLDSGWPYVETDARGAFRLGGLMDREYELEAMDPNTLMRARSHGVRAGARGVEIVLSHEEAWEAVRGRVLDGAGKPVGNARVALTCDAFRTRLQGQVVRTRHGDGLRVETDEQGRFELRDVPMENAYFRIDHPDTIPAEVGRSEQALRDLIGKDHEDFTLVVMRRCHFQIELVEPSEADQFEIHDLRGAVLQVSEFEGNGRRDGYRFDLLDGRTNLLAVGDSAATLVLFKDGAEVKRMPIELVPGQRPTLRL